ncbi:MAG: aminotransferase class III-fold pyridoxal phosphate-dependent enzyme [Phycisphaerales bacterium]
MDQCRDITAIDNLLAAEYGLSGSLTRLAGENENYLVETESGDRYVLKCVGDSIEAPTAELEHRLVEAAEAADLRVQLPRIIRTKRGTIEASHTERRARLFEFVSGVPWCEAEASSRARRTDLGRLVAKLTNGLAVVDDPAAARTHQWDLTAALAHRDTVAMIDDRDRQRALDRAFHLFAALAEPRLAALPHSVIHGDLNDENLLVDGDRICGILDFGDCLRNPTICELAIALTYVFLHEEEPLAAGADVVAGHHACRRLTVEEVELLFPLLIGRLANSVCVSARRRLIDPGRESWFFTEDCAWKTLLRCVTFSPAEAARELARSIDVEPFGDTGPSSDELLARRGRVISSALSLSYEEPLKITRGEGQYLFDHNGRPYLDLYNNVCHVGHCHPAVVAAGQRQMEKLNTNTRYLYDGLIEYAERLCATLPATLEYCFIVNSGSEANELALRLARTHTGHKDMLVVENAYHGHTSELINISPYKFMGKGGRGAPEPWVHIIPVADGYRGRYRGHDGETGRKYAQDVRRIIEAVDQPIAGFISESLLSCGGQVMPPEGYMAGVLQAVRDAGGVCILDEVQVGFGRVGTHFWAFQQQGVVPDIVVMGKPIGNGHPLGAVVTTAPIAQSFAEAGMEFFSTFGGNPVSCAIGMAVLDVVQNERLQERALRVGTRFLDGLGELMHRHPIIGDVRGTGLFIGVELVRDRTTLEPAAEETANVVNALRARGILTGTDGPFENVIKIKPPMVLSEENVDMALRVMDDILREI